MNKPECQPFSFNATQDDLRQWLEHYAEQHRLHYVLAHAEDGVIWGEFRGQNSQLSTSGDDDVFPHLAKLRTCTLQQCRAFGKNAEVMLWKVDQNNWKARLIQDNNNPECLPDEHQILWGTQKEAEKNGFSLVADGQQGLRHAVPLINISFPNNQRPLRLTVRHYITYDDDTGVARVYLSRLVNLTTHTN